MDYKILRATSRKNLVDLVHNLSAGWRIQGGPFTFIGPPMEFEKNKNYTGSLVTYFAQAAVYESQYEESYFFSR